MSDILVLVNEMPVDDLLLCYEENFEFTLEDGAITSIDRKE